MKPFLASDESADIERVHVLLCPDMDLSLLSLEIGDPVTCSNRKYLRTPVPILRKVSKTTYGMIHFGHTLLNFLVTKPLTFPNRRHYLQFFGCTLKGV